MQTEQAKIENMLKTRAGVTVGSIARDLGVGYTTAGSILSGLQIAGRVTEEYDSSVGGFGVIGQKAPKTLFIIASAEEAKRIPDATLESADVVLVVAHADLLRVEKNRHGSIGGLISWKGIPNFFASIQGEKIARMRQSAETEE